jgi:hypothetical protein
MDLVVISRSLIRELRMEAHQFPIGRHQIAGDIAALLQLVIEILRIPGGSFHPDEDLTIFVDLVGQDKQLLPLKIIPVRELDSVNLERALRHYRFSLDYGIDTVGRFEAAVVPVIRENSSSGFLFAYEEDLRVEDQVALFAHVVGHLLINHQQRQTERLLDLDPDTGETHTDRLAELRYLGSSKSRNYLDRKVLDSFPKLTKLIEVPEESDVVQNLETRDLNPLLRKQGWVNQYVNAPYHYTQGRVIPNSV